MNLYKQALAQIIHDNGGWVSVGGYAAQDKDDSTIWFSIEKPTRRKGQNYWVGDKRDGIACDRVLSNWFCVVLSRNEYFHLYPAPDADGWIEWKGGECPVNGDELVVCKVRSGREWRDGKAIMAKVLRWRHTGGIADIIAYRLHKPEQAKPESDPVEEAKSTIEQLASDYRNRKDYADRKQQEADAAKADAEAKLAELVAAGKAHGLVLSVAGAEPELVITDWRDLRVGDRIWVGDSGRSRNCPEGEYEIAAIVGKDSDQPIGLAWPGGLSGVTWPQIHKRGWRFIRRPAKGDTNA